MPLYYVSSDNNNLSDTKVLSIKHEKMGCCFQLVCLSVRPSVTLMCTIFLSTFLEDQPNKSSKIFTI